MLTVQQLEFRKQGIGSSDVAALLGEDPFKGELDVWLDKTGRVPNSEMNDQAEMGHLLEPIIAARFAKRSGFKIRRMTTMAHKDHSWAMATPDRAILNRRELLEAKNVGHRMLRYWRGIGDSYRVPSYVVLQCQWQLLVTGYDAAWVVAFLGGRDPFEVRLEADKETQEALLSFVRQWWERHIIGDIEPDPAGTERAKKLLERLYSRSIGDLVQPTIEIEELAKAYVDARAAESTAAKAKLAAGNMLRAKLGAAPGTKEAPWGHVQWTESKGRVSWADVAKALDPPPELLEAHTKSGGRTLRVKVYGHEGDDE